MPGKSSTPILGDGNSPTTEFAGQAPAIISSSPAIESFSPDKRIIRAAEIELRKISPYLRDLPGDAKAWLLVAPHNLENIDHKEPGELLSTIKRIGEIKNYHGLNGMQIANHNRRPLQSVSYQENLTSQIRTAFDLARRREEPFTTGLFLGTLPIVFGWGSAYGSLENNLYSLRKKIDRQGDPLVPKDYKNNSSEKVYPNMQWTCTESWADPEYFWGVDFHTVFGGFFDSKEDHRHRTHEFTEQRIYLAARPVALEILPPGP